MFEIRSFEFVKTQYFMQNKKNFKFGTENVLCEYFWAVVLKNYFHI